MSLVSIEIASCKDFQNTIIKSKCDLKDNKNLPIDRRSPSTMVHNSIISELKAIISEFSGKTMPHANTTNQLIEESLTALRVIIMLET